MKSNILTIIPKETNILQPSDDNLMIVSNLERVPMNIQLVGLKPSSLNSLSQKIVEEKLKVYDKTIGITGTQNIFTEAYRSEWISSQQDVVVTEGVFSFCVRTDPQTGIYWFKSRLETSNKPSLVAESTERQVFFQVPTDAISVDHAMTATQEQQNESEEVFETKEEQEEWKKREENADKVLGQSKIYTKTNVPSTQYFVRKVIESDRDYGLAGIAEVLRQRAAAKPKKSASTKRGSIRIKKTLPLPYGIYEYEISNKAPNYSRLYFSSRFRYYVQTEKENTLEESFVLGSNKRLILEK